MSGHPFIDLPPELEHAIRRTRLIAFDFDGVFTDNMVYVSEEGIESVRCWRSDGLGLKKLEPLGIASVIVSTEVNEVVQARSRKLRMRCFHGCENKVETVTELLEEMSLEWDEIAFVGNDINDLGVLERVGLPIIVQDAHRDVAHAAKYRTRTPGGHGAVREVCDLFEFVLGNQR